MSLLLSSFFAYYIQIRNSNTITCDGGNNCSSTIDCNENEDCLVECLLNESCQDITINCPSNYECSLHVQQIMHVNEQYLMHQHHQNLYYI